MPADRGQRLFPAVTRPAAGNTAIRRKTGAHCADLAVSACFGRDPVKIGLAIFFDIYYNSNNYP